MLLRMEGAGRAAQGMRGFARAAQRVALMVRRDLGLNLASADVPLLPLGIWFDSGFWPVSNSSHRLPTAVLKGFVFGKRWKSPCWKTQRWGRTATK